NGTAYGLGGGLWTRDLQRAHRVAGQMHSGMVWINCYKRVNPGSPFGGVRGSGYGREMGFEAMHEYTETKSVWVHVDAQIPPFYPRGAGRRGSVLSMRACRAESSSARVASTRFRPNLNASAASAPSCSPPGGAGGRMPSPAVSAAALWVSTTKRSCMSRSRPLAPPAPRRAVSKPM